MRIAQVAPLMTDVPPKGYGGPERVVSYLTDELVRQGHDVTLFATAESQTLARHVPVSPHPLIYRGWEERIIVHLLMLEQVFKHAEQFDIIHSHLGHIAAPFIRRHRIPVLTTPHEMIRPEEALICQEYADIPLSSLSYSQRNDPFPDLNWVGTVHNALPKDLYSFRAQHSGYLAFIGRIVPAKGVELAIEIAKRTGIPLKIAGNRAPFADAYYQEMLELFKHPLIEFVGEITDVEKQEFFGNALAFLFPITTLEPFGLVMIEALACGTPVIASKMAAVPEVITDGVNGFACEDLDAFVAAVGQVASLDRRRCRETFEQHFTAPRMTTEYVALFEQVIRGRLEAGPEA